MTRREKFAARVAKNKARAEAGRFSKLQNDDDESHEAEESDDDSVDSDMENVFGGGQHGGKAEQVGGVEEADKLYEEVKEKLIKKKQMRSFFPAANNPEKWPDWKKAIGNGDAKDAKKEKLRDLGAVAKGMLKDFVKEYVKPDIFIKESAYDYIEKKCKDFWLQGPPNEMADMMVILVFNQHESEQYPSIAKPKEWPR